MSGRTGLSICFTRQYAEDSGSDIGVRLSPHKCNTVGGVHADEGGKHFS